MDATVANPAWRTPVQGEEEMVQANIGLVHHILRRDFSGLKIEYEDALQIGLEGLLRAVRTYPGKEIPFAAWATGCIRNALLSANRYQKAKKRKAVQPLVYIDAPLSKEDDRVRDIADPGQDLEREAVANIKVWRLMERLSSQDRQMVTMLLDGKTQAEIAEKMGISPYIIQERINKMRKIIKEEKPMKGPDESGGVQNSLADMNTFLFEQMKRLSSDKLTESALAEEVKRSKAMADVATRIIQSGELVLRAHTFRDRQVDTSDKLPRLLSGNE